MKFDKKEWEEAIRRSEKMGETGMEIMYGGVGRGKTAALRASFSMDNIRTMQGIMAQQNLSKNKKGCLMLSRVDLTTICNEMTKEDFETFKLANGQIIRGVEIVYIGDLNYFFETYNHPG